MSIPRSKSAPHVHASQPFLSPASTSNTSRARRPNVVLPRHRSAFALSEATSSAASSSHYTPLVERTEDPFNLTGFFSSGLSVPDKQSESSWGWLRPNEDGGNSESESRYMASGCVSPISEEDAELFYDEKPCLFFDKLKNRLAGEVIREEDKLGVLSLPGVFVSEYIDDASSYDYLLSRYNEGDPEDDNALYETLCALRQSHMPVDDLKNDIGIDVRQGLFSPTDDGKDEYPILGGHGWQSLLWQGFDTILDVVSV